MSWDKKSLDHVIGSFAKEQIHKWVISGDQINEGDSKSWHFCDPNEAYAGKQVIAVYNNGEWVIVYMIKDTVVSSFVMTAQLVVKHLIEKKEA